jgi:ABC-2 type transport system ATP-binding protein
LTAIQTEYGADTVHVRLEGPGPLYEGLPGVAAARSLGPHHELRLAPGADAQQLLAELMRRGRVVHFEFARPSLHDIFVRIARPEAGDMAHA